MARSRVVFISTMLGVVLAAGFALAQPCIDYSALVHPDPVGSFSRADASAADGSHICSANYRGMPAEVAWFRIEDDQSLVREGTYNDYSGTSYFPKMAVSGELAILATYDRLSIVDFSAPESPVLLSQITAPGMIDDIAVCGDVVCIGINSQGVWFVQISDPSKPVVRPLMPLDGDQFHPQGAGSVCWVASLNSGDSTCHLTSIDTTDPENLSVIGNVEFGPVLYEWATLRFRADDGLAVVNAQSSLSEAPRMVDCWVCDVTDPAAPVVLHADLHSLGKFAIHQHVLYSPLTWSGGITAYRIHSDGTLTWDGCQDTRIANLDIVSTVHAAWAIGSEIMRLSPVGGADPILFRRDYYDFWDNQWHDFFYRYYLVGCAAADGLVFLQNGNSNGDMGGTSHGREVTVFDVSDPATPVLLQSCASHGGYDWETEHYDRIAVHGDYLYTDISASGTWHWRSNTRVSDFHFERGYFIGGAALYTEAPTGLEVRDLSVPENPPYVGPLLAEHDVRNLVAIGDRAYAQCGASLVVLDVGAPLSPLVVEELPMADSGTCAAVSAEALLLAGETGLVAFDLHAQEQGHPVQVGSLPGFVCDDVELSGGVAYLIVRDQGLLVVDVTDLANLEVIGRFDALGFSRISLTSTCLAATTSNSNFVLIALDCSDSVPVYVQDFAAAWQGDGFHLAWRLARDAADLHLVASAGGHTWTVPWSREVDGYNAFDNNAHLNSGGSVMYVLSVRDDTGNWQELSRTTAIVPALTTALLAPRPNPFNPSTTLALTLEHPTDILLTIHDLAGHEVRRLVDGPLSAGLHAPRWDGRDGAGRQLPAGTYLARLRAGDRVEMQKLSLVK